MSILQYKPVQANISSELIKQVQGSVNPLGSVLSGLGKLALDADKTVQDKITDEWQRYQNRQAYVKDIAYFAGVKWRTENPEEYAHIMNLAFSGPEGYQKAQADMAQYDLPPSVLDDFMKASQAQLTSGDTSRDKAASIADHNASTQSSLATANLYNIRAKILLREEEQAQAEEAARIAYNSLTPEQQSELFDLYNQTDKTAFLTKSQQLLGNKVNPEKLLERMQLFSGKLPQNTDIATYQANLAASEKAEEAFRKRTFVGDSGITLHDWYTGGTDKIDGIDTAQINKKKEMLQAFLNSEGNTALAELADEGIKINPELHRYLTLAAMRALESSQGNWLRAKWKPGKEEILDKTDLNKNTLKAQLRKINDTITNNRDFLASYDPLTGIPAQARKTYANALNKAVKKLNPIKGISTEDIDKVLEEADKELKLADPGFANKNTRDFVMGQIKNAVLRGQAFPSEFVDPGLTPEQQAAQTTAAQSMQERDLRENILTVPKLLLIDDNTFLTMERTETEPARKNVFAQARLMKEARAFSNAEEALRANDSFTALKILINSPFVREIKNQAKTIRRGGENIVENPTINDFYSIAKRVLLKAEQDIALLSNASSQKVPMQNAINQLRAKLK